MTEQRLIIKMAEALQILFVPGTDEFYEEYRKVIRAKDMLKIRAAFNLAKELIRQYEKAAQ